MLIAAVVHCDQSTSSEARHNEREYSGLNCIFETHGLPSLQDALHSVTVELVELLDEASMTLLWSYDGIKGGTMVRM